jgi:hypothetical protein
MIYLEFGHVISEGSSIPSGYSYFAGGTYDAFASPKQIPLKL